MTLKRTIYPLSNGEFFTSLFKSVHLGERFTKYSALAEAALNLVYYLFLW